MSCTRVPTASATTGVVTVRQVSTRSTLALESPTIRPTLSHSAASSSGAKRSRCLARSATVGMSGSAFARRHANNDENDHDAHDGEGIFEGGWAVLDFFGLVLPRRRRLLRCRRPCQCPGDEEGSQPAKNATAHRRYYRVP